MAAISLIATAISTYYSAAVSKDQLDQSREDSELKAREQASRVTFWTEYSKDGQKLVIGNRSLDPFTMLGLLFDVNSETAYRTDDRSFYDAPPATIAPCTKVFITPPMIRLKNGKRLTKSATFNPQWLRFSDAKGDTWARSISHGLFNLDRDAILPEEYKFSFDAHAEPTKPIKRYISQIQQSDLLHLKGEPLEGCVPNK
ncbi:hypothetical protein [Streptomyces sp. NPDC057557]|uniref:hypothetical protein n=1 Tax=Streptomyces sp. NPDC057557 TaxID=3346167 RepID=UPI0036A385FF